MSWTSWVRAVFDVLGVVALAFAAVMTCGLFLPGGTACRVE
jgi:hypothetical protein